MKNIKNLIIASFIAAALPLAAMVPVSTFAQEGTTWFGETADGQWLVGVKLGQIINDDDGFSDADNTTLVLGYQFAREIGTRGTASIELEIGSSDDASINIGFPGSTWEAQTLGLFINYRTPGTVYFKTKLGFLSSDIETRIGGAPANSENDASFAYGAGFGVVLGAQQNFNVELEWTGTSGDNDINLVNLGGHYRF